MNQYNNRNKKRRGKREILTCTNCVYFVQGEWSEAAGTAGGCTNTPSWKINPQYEMHVTKNSRLLIMLDRPGCTNDAYIGFYVLKSEGNVTQQIFSFCYQKVVWFDFEFQSFFF